MQTKGTSHIFAVLIILINYFTTFCTKFDPGFSLSLFTISLTVIVSNDYRKVLLVKSALQIELSSVWERATMSVLYQKSIGVMENK